VLVAGVVGDLAQVFGGDGGPEGFAGDLHVVAQLPVVQPQAPVVVGGCGGAIGAVEAVVEQAVGLLDRIFVDALLLHDLEGDGHVQRDHRDGSAGLGDDGLHHADVGFEAGVAATQLLGGVVQVLLGLAQGAVPVHRPGDLGADVAVGDGLGVLGQYAGGAQRVDPQRPVLAAHHSDGVLDFLLGGRLDGGLDHGVLVGVDRGVGERLADGLERRAHHFAGVRQLAHGRGQRIDHQVDRATHLVLDDLDRTRAGFVGERVAVDRLAVQAGLLGRLVERGGVVPTGGAGLLRAAGLLEEHAERGGAVAEC